MTVSRLGRCWYCAQPNLRVDDPPEHVIPDAMAGTLKTDRVCRECNHRAGRAIDGPFMRDWMIAMDRGLHAPRGGRMQPRVEASLDDGTRVDLETGKGPWKAKIRGGIERKRDQVRIRASNRDEYERLLARVRRDVEAEGKQFVEPLEPTEGAYDGMIVVRTSMEGVIWLRMAAKITLACSSLVLDESWLDSPDAAKYRGWLWDEKPVNEDGAAALGFPVDLNELEKQVLSPPEHLLYFGPLRDGLAVLSVAYFGTTVVRAAIDPAGQPTPRMGWKLRRSEPPQPVTLAELAMEAALKCTESTPSKISETRTMAQTATTTDGSRRMPRRTVKIRRSQQPQLECLCRKGLPLVGGAR